MGLPLADVNPTRRQPWVTRLLVAANLAVALAVAVGGPCAQLAAVGRYGVIAATLMGPDEVALGSCGVVDSVGPLALLSHAFVHAGWLHLGGNMLYLWVFGDNVEDRLGHTRFALLYLGSGVAAALAEVVVGGAGNRPMVGASGAVAGVLGAYLVSFPTARVASLLSFPLSLLAFVLRSRLNLLVVSVVELPAWIVLLAWVWLQLQGLATPVDPGVAVTAHVGGLVAGVLLVLRLRRGVPDLTPAGRRRRTV